MKNKILVYLLAVFVAMSSVNYQCLAHDEHEDVHSELFKTVVGVVGL